MVSGVGTRLPGARTGRALLTIDDAQPVTRYDTFQFTGDGREYFRIWIVNIVLSVVTLGVLDDNGVSRDPLVRMLTHLEESARRRGAGSGDGSVLGYLSSHPVTRERIEAARRVR
jgi:hypothetical protein